MKGKLNNLSTAVRLLIIGVLIFSIAYSGIIGIVGQTLWNEKAEGSLIKENGEIVGSELIGQNFDDPQFFHGRTSSIDYNAMKSGSQNLAPQEEILFQVKYENYRDDLESGILPDDIREKFEQIDRSLPKDVKVVYLGENKWRIKENGETLYSIRTDGEELEFYRRSKLARRVENSLEHISNTYENETVPADFVTESGSALDPHITVRSAVFQIPRVSRNTGIPEDNLRSIVEKYSQEKLLGLYGMKRVNVLNLNLKVKRIMEED